MVEEGYGGERSFHARFQQAAQGRRCIRWRPKAWLARPSQARSGSKDGAPITDGVFPESKEFLAGYWIVDVESPEQAYNIAARVSAAPGPDGAPGNMPIEVRQVLGSHSDLGL